MSAFAKIFPLPQYDLYNNQMLFSDTAEISIFCEPVLDHSGSSLLILYTGSLGSSMWATNTKKQNLNLFLLLLPDIYIIMLCNYI